MQLDLDSELELEVEAVVVVGDRLLEMLVTKKFRGGLAPGIRQYEGQEDVDLLRGPGWAFIYIFIYVRSCSGHCGASANVILASEA